MSTTIVTPKRAELLIIDVMERFGPDLRGVSRESRLADLGVESRDLIELARIIDEELGVRPELAELGRLRTVGDTIDLVVARAS
jgi:acyl carrier protein